MSDKLKPTWLMMLAGLVYALALELHAATYRAGPLDYEGTILLLEAGDTLVLGPGVYRNGLTLRNMAGEPQRPIVIQGGTGTVFRARDDRNTISIGDARYIIVRGLELEGDNQPVDAIKSQRGTTSHDIVLENLTIRGHGNNQQTVGISTKGTAWRWIIRANTIVGAGTGMYLGDSDGSAPFVAGVIENNVVIDTIGYNIEIKHQQPRPAIEGMPDGPSTTIIRHNVFAKTRQFVSPDGPRPNLLVGHSPLSGSGAHDRYAIYGNFFYQNAQEALFQGEGNVALYSNVFVNPSGDAVHIQPHNDVPRNILVAFNTVVATGAGISIVGKGKPEESGAFPQRVFRNAVFAGRPIVGGIQTGNVVGAYGDAATYLSRPLARVGALDVFPKRPLVARAVDDDQEDLPDWRRDFDDRARLPARIGAYASAARGPAWTLRLGPKKVQAKR